MLLNNNIGNTRYTLGISSGIQLLFYSSSDTKPGWDWQILKINFTYIDWLLECRIHNGYFWFKRLLRFLCNFWCWCWINSISEQRDDTSLHNLHSRSCVYTPLQSINRIRDPSQPQLSHHCSTLEEVIRSMALSFIEMNSMV